MGLPLRWAAPWVPCQQQGTACSSSSTYTAQTPTMRRLHRRVECLRLPPCRANRTSPSGWSAEDPFVAAANRLESLLRGVGSGEEELLEKLVANETPESKLQTSAVLGGLMCTAAAAISMLCAHDSFGATLPSADDSLAWAAVGALAGLPLVALRLWSWSQQASQSLPALDDMHRQQLQICSPWFNRMSRAHVAVMLVLEVLPMTLLLLPAAQGVVHAWSGAVVGASSLGGGEPHEQLVRLGGLLLTATLAAVATGMELSLSEEEYEVVQTAVEHSDRYYRVTGCDINSRAPEAERAALAFRCVAQVYLEARSDASLLAGAITFMDILFLGFLYFCTGSVAAPVTAAIAFHSVDYHHLHQAVEKGKGSGSGA